MSVPVDPRSIACDGVRRATFQTCVGGQTGNLTFGRLACDSLSLQLDDWFMFFGSWMWEKRPEHGSMLDACTLYIHTVPGGESLRELELWARLSLPEPKLFLR